MNEENKAENIELGMEEMMKIVVLAGGTSSEREVSIVTSTKVCESLRKNGHDANMVDVFFGIEDERIDNFFNEKNDLESLSEELKNKSKDVKNELKRRNENSESFFGNGVLELCKESDIVFIGLHGSNGEDGKIQAAFDLLGIKYTGTDYISSAISMSKDLTKKVLVSEGVPMPKGITLEKGQKIEYVPYPCVVKPCCGGSSVGVSIVKSDEEFKKALDVAFSYENKVLVEEFVEGREFSVGVLDGKAFPVIEIEPVEGFYDYENKYKAGATKETCPADLPKEISERMQRWAEIACEAVGLKTYARVDELVNDEGEIYCLEINTLPGMTGTSLLPQEAAAVGISYDQLTQKIVDISLEKYK
ncbi:MAG: D-alanine--D-alanine ligase [Lachnospira sp.]